MLVRKQIETSRRSCHSLTADVADLINRSGIEEGYCFIQLEDHTTALGITSFWDPRGLEDMLNEIDRNFPARVHMHNRISTYDAIGRVKSVVFGTSALLMIQNRKLILGSSQGLVLIENDGPQIREYSVLLKECKVSTKVHRLNTVYMGMHDLTAEVSKDIEEAGMKNGICHISMLHSTAGLLMARKKEEALQDIMHDIERMVPTRGDFLHRETASDAGGHIKTALTDSQLTLIVQDGKLLLGEDQAIVFAEYDGPRPRSYTVGLLKDEEHNDE